MADADMDGLKIFWGAIFTLIFLHFAVSFVKRAVKSQDIKYNWFGVALSFSAIGLALYLIFFRQM